MPGETNSLKLSDLFIVEILEKVKSGGVPVPYISFPRSLLKLAAYHVSD